MISEYILQYTNQPLQFVFYHPLRIINKQMKIFWIKMNILAFIPHTQDLFHLFGTSIKYSMWNFLNSHKSYFTKWAAVFNLFVNYFCPFLYAIETKNVITTIKLALELYFINANPTGLRSFFKPCYVHKINYMLNTKHLFGFNQYCII